MTGNGTGDAEALREEIRRTRVELGETMELLVARADVKARLRESAGRPLLLDQPGQVDEGSAEHRHSRRNTEHDGEIGAPVVGQTLADE